MSETDNSLVGAAAAAEASTPPESSARPQRKCPCALRIALTLRDITGACWIRAVPAAMLWDTRAQPDVFEE